jgi:excisionase family DNA binding protein
MNGQAGGAAPPAPRSVTAGDVQLQARKRLLKIGEASERLGIAEKTLYNWSSMGKIDVVRGTRLLRFDSEVLDRWIADHTVKARA